MGHRRGRGSADVPVTSGFSEGSAGLREQSRGYRGDRRGIGLAHPASAFGSQSQLLVSGGRRATTRYAEYRPLAQGKSKCPTRRSYSRSSTASMPISTTASSGCLRCCGSNRFRPIRPLPEIARPLPIILPKTSHRWVWPQTSGRPPVIPLSLWHRPPFEPVVTDHADGRKIIVARGAEDDKGQLMTFVEACRAWKSVTGSLPVDVTILIEGEEEIGSKNFVPFLEANKGELKADFAMVCDTGMWDPNTPAITTSLRGLVYEEVKIKAANRDLHSGVFGGGAQNPIRVLTRILGGLFDEDGHITIPGFYDGVKDLPPDILAQWSKLNLTPESFLKPIGLSVPAGEKGRLLIEQISSRPTCDVNGIIGGYTGEGSKTVIPAEASAKISFRLVEGQDPGKIRKAFRDYVTARLPKDCKAEFGDHSSAPAIALDWNMKPLAAAKRALTEEWGKETVLMGFGLDDDNIHSPNEKYDLKSFHKGIRSWARILAALAEAPR